MVARFLFAATAGATILLLGSPSSLLVAAKEGKWECRNGFWYNDGEKSQWTCGKGDYDDDKDDYYGDKDDYYGEKESKGDNSCSLNQLPDFHRTCIRGPPNNSIRCWWTYVPDGVKKGSKVPLIVDMHGGGGCAHHQLLSSGFKELADAKNFIVVFPQGASPDGFGGPGRWNTCGSDVEACKASEKGKEIIDWDDIGFLRAMLATIIKSKAKSPWKFLVDPRRLFLSGFSEGCMMAQRMAMEKSSIIAGMTCHGGRLIGADTNTVSKLPIPTHIYLTGGSDDGWFEMETFKTWKKLNGCKNGQRREDVSLASSSATLLTARRCKRGAVTARLEIAGAGHTVDAQMPSLAMEAMLNAIGSKVSKWRSGLKVKRRLGKAAKIINCISSWSSKRCSNADGCVFVKRNGKSRCEIETPK